RRLTTNYDSLNSLVNRLPPNRFFQISRQFIVHLDAVRTVRDDVNRKLTITLEPALSPGLPAGQVTISRYRSAEFRQWLTEMAGR
ncbi:MAG: LytTR family transcriptional regulator DNA-binding domain-containing protein, partial [Bacteroidetes bacterium]|nr:LytTR family transcriptional regulator DNA-binding domain-containing protein [Fibrella sp.]